MPPEAPKPYVKPEVRPNSKTGGKEAAPEKPEEILIPSSAKTAALLSPENKGFFSKMSKGGKDIANGVFAKLYESSAIKRLDRGVKHIEVAYQQKNMSKYEEKTVQLKTQMDGLKMQADGLESAKEKIRSAQERLIKLGAPGAESLELQIKDIDKEKSKLLNKADQMQSKFEAVENVMKLYANKRDRVADRLINDYSEKLKPMEKELGVLVNEKNQMNLSNAVMMMQHKKEAFRLDEIEKNKTEIEEALRDAGLSESKIRKSPAVSAMDKEIKTGRKEIMREQEQKAKEMEKINEKIATMDAKANPYRDKREEFVRVKEGRPIKIEVPNRVRGAGHKGAEETKGHTREEVIDSGPEIKEEAEKSSKERKSEGSAAESETDMEVGQLISTWNSHLKVIYGDAVSAEEVKKMDFVKATGLWADYKIDPQDFKNILGFYYDLKKNPKDKFWTGMTTFEQKLKDVK